jgi:hypothetical protein
MRQLLCVFEAAEIEAFPNLRHSSPSLSATSLGLARLNYAPTR